MSCVSVDLWLLELFACCQLIITIIIVAVISIAPGRVMDEHTARYKINNNVCIKTSQIISS